MANTNVPPMMRKLFSNGQGQPPIIRDIPVPQPGEGELLIKVVAVAQNPTDWKAATLGNAGLGLGVDFAGAVVSSGPSTSASFAPGDRVSGFAMGGQDKDHGAMAEYAIVDASLVWRIPEGKSFEEASTMNCGLWTAIQALFHTPRLALPVPAQSTPREAAPWVLIYSGATSVGQYAIQLAHYAGYRVITTTSPKNFELVKSLGADVAVDYRDREVAAEIREATSDTLQYGFDTISEEETQKVSVRAFGKNGGKLIVLSSARKEARELRPDVQITHTLLYTISGYRISRLGMDFPAAPGDHHQMREWMGKITELWQNGQIQPNKVQIRPGGLDAIPEGFQYMKEGNISAVKLVYTI